jgi:hypothetical protein
MDKFTYMFWIGVFILLISHILLFKEMPIHCTISLVGLFFMFIGSKIGREFLGIS